MRMVMIMTITVRELIDRLLCELQSGELKGSDPVPEGFLQDGHMSVAEYIADKYDIRSDADE